MNKDDRSTLLKSDKGFHNKVHKQRIKLFSSFNINIGANMTLTVTVNGLSKHDNITCVALVGKNGNDLAEYVTGQQTNDSKQYFKLNIIIPLTVRFYSILYILF